MGIFPVEIKTHAKIDRETDERGTVNDKGV